MTDTETTGIQRAGNVDGGAAGAFDALRQVVDKAFPRAEVNYRESESGAALAILKFAPEADPARLELDGGGKLSIWVREDDMPQWQHYLKSR